MDGALRLYLLAGHDWMFHGHAGVRAQGFCVGPSSPPTRPIFFLKQHARDLNTEVLSHQLTNVSRRNLEPGGVLEMQDLTHPVRSDDGTLTEDLELRRLGLLFIEAAAKAGRPLDVAPQYKTFLERAGFVDIVERQFKWPLNHWPKDKHFKELGTWSFQNLDDGLEGLLLAMYTRHLGWTKDEVLLFCSKVRKQLRDTTIHGYIPM